MGPKKKGTKETGTGGKDREKAEHLLKQLDVSLTGAQPGDTLTGAAKATQGALVLLSPRSAPIPPTTSSLELVRSFPDLWNRFLERASGLPSLQAVYENGGKDAIAATLLKRALDVSGYQFFQLGVKYNKAAGPVYLVVLDLGSGELRNDIVEEEQDEIIGQELTARQLFDRFIVREGQEASNERRNLHQLPSRWRVAVQFRVEPNPSAWRGWTFDVDRATFYDGTPTSTPSTTHDLYVVPWKDVVTHESKEEKKEEKEEEEKYTREVGIWVRKLNWDPSFSNVADAVAEVLPHRAAETKRVRAVFAELNRRWSPAYWKSFLQKMIRFSRPLVLLPGTEQEVLPADVCLLTGMAHLLVHPGSLVPDLKIFVTGQASVFKRLCIIAFEDSYISSSLLPSIFRLAVFSLLSQRVRSWRPAREYVLETLQTALALHQEPRYFVYDRDNKLPLVRLQPRQTAWDTISALMDSVKSFPGDLAMVRDIAHQRQSLRSSPKKSSSSPRESKEEEKKDSVIPLIHVLDQHCAPDIAYYYESKVVEREFARSSTPSAPFSGLFDRLFNEVTGINTRKMTEEALDKLQASSFWNETREAQYLFWIAKMHRFSRATRKPTSSERLTLDYTIPRGYLSGWIGTLSASIQVPSETKSTTKTTKPKKEGKEEKKEDEEKKKKKSVRTRNKAVYVTIVPSDIETLNAVAIVKGRGEGKKSKTEQDPLKKLYLSATEQKLAIEAGLRILENGVTLRAIPDPPVASWRGATAYWNSSQARYIIELANEPAVAWDTLRVLNMEIRFGPEVEGLDLETCLINGAGPQVPSSIATDMSRELDALIRRTPLPHLQFVLSFLAGFPQTVSMPHLSRDGGGTEQAPSVEWVGAFQFLLRLAALAPSALRRGEFQPTTFSVELAPLLWTLRDHLKERVDAALARRQPPPPPTSTAGTSSTSSGSREEKKRETSVARRELERICGTDQEQMRAVATLDPVWGRSLQEKKARSLLPTQLESLPRLIGRYRDGHRAFLLWQGVGTGKTATVLHFANCLHVDLVTTFPRFMMWIGPKDSLPGVLPELERFGLRVILLDPTIEGAKARGHKPLAMIPGAVHVVQHDHARLIKSLLLQHAAESFVVVDEVHFAMAPKTQRTTSLLEVARLAAVLVAMTGTLVTDGRIHGLKNWFNLLSDFPVTRANFWNAAADVVSIPTDLNIDVRYQEVVVAWTGGREKEYRQLVGPALGGTNPRPTPKEFARALELCYEQADESMVLATRRFLQEQNKGVMLVALDKDHALRLQDLVIEWKVADAADVMALTTKTIYLTDERVEQKKIHDFQVVIVPVRRSTGYSLSRLKAMITSVYPSSQATRTQLLGRIRRQGQSSKLLLHQVHHLGILTHILENHLNAANFEAVLSYLST